MTIKIKFDAAHNPEVPTIVLARKNGDKLGKINASAIEVSDSLNDASEITFNVYKYVDGKQCELWNEIVDFKLVHCVEWDMWFEIRVEVDESVETMKTVFCTQLGQAELSQIMLYDIEINTEDDIAREEYVRPTVLFRTDYPDSSLLHRIMEKADHYSVIHVDDTIAGIQRTFSFDDTSIYDAFQEIAEEIHCLFVLHSNSDKHGGISRTISVYDLESNCIDCGHRGEFTNVCPECGSVNINEGYGDDTTIFVTADELAEHIQLSTDTDSVKNCFKLEAGDDLMTATIRNCNPNGTDYLWYISDSVKKDMSQELVDKIESYDEQYSYYQKDYVVNLNESMLARYNGLVNKYKKFDKNLENIKTPIKGYPSLMNAYYNTIDFELYLRSALMPSVEISDTNAVKEADKLTRNNLSPVSVQSVEYLSLASADNAVMSMAKVIVDSRYRIKVKESSLSSGVSSRVWTGRFTVTNYSDDEDTATSNLVSVTVNNDYENFINQKLEKALDKEDTNDLSISGLFKLDGDDFIAELKKYSLNRLISFHDACQSCIDILIEQGISDKKTWSGKDPNLYDDIYLVYRQKLEEIEKEMKIRQDEVDLISGVYYTNGDLKTYGMQTYIEDAKCDIQDHLDFEEYLGTDLWMEFCTFRREDKFSNDNYISDGLNNAELFDKAREFIRVASNEIYKSAELQHSISASLNNLLVIKKFAPLVNSFQVGNWIRVLIDGEVYKLRLLEYSIDYDDIASISVEFSDVDNVNSSVNSIQDIISQASSMATSYESIQRQAEQGNNGKRKIDGWVNDGLEMTNMKIVSNADNQNMTWDSHGILCREWLPITEQYDNRQLKIINRGLYVTDDGWKTSRAGIGNFLYPDPKNDWKITEAYGVIADTLVGNLILSESVGIYNDKNNMTLDDHGFAITLDNDSDSSQVAFTIQKKSTDESGTEHIEKLMYVDDDGNLTLNGSININTESDQKIETLDDFTTRLVVAETNISNNSEQIVLSASKTLEDANSYTDSQIKIASDSITSTVNDFVSGRFSQLEQTVDGLSVEIGDARKVATNYLEYTSSGLTVGNKQSGSWDGTRARMGSSSFDILDTSGTSMASYGAAARIGYSDNYNTYIDGNGVQIRNGSTINSTFGNNIIKLGQNSTNSRIEIAAGSILINGSANGSTGSFQNSAGAGLHIYGGGFSSTGGDSFTVLSSASGRYEAAYGRHGSSLSKSSFDDLLGAVVLYESTWGSTGATIYLSTNGYGYQSNNIVALEIFCKLVSSVGESRYFSQKVYDPNGKDVMLYYVSFRRRADYSDMYLGASEIHIELGTGAYGSGTITLRNGNDAYGTQGIVEIQGSSSGGVKTISAQNKIAIMKVVGYR